VLVKKFFVYGEFCSWGANEVYLGMVFAESFLLCSLIYHNHMVEQVHDILVDDLAICQSQH